MMSASALTTLATITVCGATTASATPPGSSDLQAPIVQTTDTGPNVLCYFIDNATLTSGMRMSIDDLGNVIGETYGSIHNEAAPYFAYYEQTHEGSVSDGVITVTTFTEIEHDRQVDHHTWTLLPDGLQRDDLVYPPADCSTVDKHFGDIEGG